VLDKGSVAALGTMAELRASDHARVRQFLDRVPEPEVSGEMDYLQMLTEDNRPGRKGRGA
jgi:phospholipid/cholesterol/gamma-HCH transport system ATP-binding protein